MSFVSRLFQDAASPRNGPTPAVAIDPKPLIDLFERELANNRSNDAPSIELAQARVVDLSRDLGLAVVPDDGTWLATMHNDERRGVVAAVEVCRSHFLFPRLSVLPVDVIGDLIGGALRAASQAGAPGPAIEALLSTLGVTAQDTPSSPGEP